MYCTVRPPGICAQSPGIGRVCAYARGRVLYKNKSVLRPGRERVLQQVLHVGLERVSQRPALQPAAARGKAAA